MSDEKPLYQLGNILRGFTSGRFNSDEEAWAVLSKRFDASFPSRKGRHVEMWKIVREGYTEGGNETEQDRKLREDLGIP